MAFDPTVSVIVSGGQFGMPTADAPMSAVIERMRNPKPTDRLIALVQAAKNAKATGDKSDYRRAKDRLPSYTVSGRFPQTGYEWTNALDADGNPVLNRKGKPKRVRTPAADGIGDGQGARNDDNLQEHNSVFALDYDGLGATDLDAAIERLKEHPSVVYIARSVGGDGFHAGVRVNLPEGIDFRNPANHKRLWLEVSSEIQESCELPKDKSDTSSQNVNRIHFFGLDPEAYWNGESEPLAVRAWEEILAGGGTRAERRRNDKSRESTANSAPTDSVDFDQRLKWLREGASFLPVYDDPDNANRFEQVYFSLEQLGENDLADRYRARHSGSRAADPNRADRAPNRPIDKSMTLNVLLKAMRENGWNDPREQRRQERQAKKNKLVGQASYESRTDVNAVEWVLAANELDVVAAYEHNPPPEADGVSAGAFYKRLPNGLLSKRSRELGGIASKAFGAYVAAAKRIGDEHETGAVITHARVSLQKIGAIRGLAEGISEVEGALANRGAESPAPIIDLARIDADKEWLGVLNGAVSLRDGTFIENAHEREIYISRFVPVRYRKGATSERFDQLLAHPTSPDAVDFVLDCAARALHRKPRQDRRFILMFDEGDESGRSGKSLVWDALAGTLGDYAAPLQKDALEKSAGEGRANPELRPLAQSALVYLKELASADIGADELKGISGETEITFRMLFGNPVTRDVIATLFASANGKPNIGLWDSAVVDRYTPIEFVRIPEEKVDNDLAQIWRGDTDESQGAREALLANLVERAVRFRDAPPPLPEWVEAAKETHRLGAIGAWGQFREARLVYTGDENDVLTMREVWAAWATWNEADDSKDRIDGMDKGKVTRWVRRDFPKSLPCTKRVNGEAVSANRGLVLRTDGEPNATPPPPPPPVQEPLVNDSDDMSAFQNVAWWAQKWGVSPTTARETCEAKVADGAMVKRGSGFSVLYSEA